MSKQQYRQEFLALADKAYFNYGGQGPMPRGVRDAIFDAYDRIQEMGPFSGQSGAWVEAQIQQTRAAIAKDLGVTADTITLTEDVTVGCNIPLWGIDWQPGQHLLMTDCEHQGIIAAVEELQRRFGIEVSIAPLMETLNDGDPVAVIERSLQPNTRLVVLSHILWNTGQVLPLADIVRVCRESQTQGSPVQVLVDAAQSVGVLPLNLAETGVDFYAFTGHKWWCGPEGAGGLYIRPEARPDVRPTFIGWRGVTLDKKGMPTGYESGGKQFEIATSAYPLYAGLQTAIDFHSQWGTAEERYQQLCRNSGHLWEKLRQIPQVTCLKAQPPEAGLVSFTIASGKHKNLVAFLESRGVFVRTILNPNCVRACAHYFTTNEEIDRLVEGVEAFLG